MSWLKVLIWTLIIGVTVFWGILFGMENDSRIAVNLVFWRSPDMAASYWLVASFALGGLAGLLASALMLAKANARNIRVKRQLQQCQKELDKARAIPGDT